MSDEPLPLPAAGCGKCGRAAESGTAVGNRCAALTPEGPCDGILRSTLSPTDWILCSTCHGSGNTATQRCSSCDGGGWHYARPRFP